MTYLSGKQENTFSLIIKVVKTNPEVLGLDFFEFTLIGSHFETLVLLVSGTVSQYLIGGNNLCHIN